MSGLSDLQAAVVALTTAVTNANALIASLASASGDNDGAVETAAQVVIAQTALLNGAVTAATPPAPAPAATASVRPSA